MATDPPAVLPVLETGRLALRELVPQDAAFILRLVNEPSWIEFIGDRGVRTLEDAERYIDTGPRQMYRRLGFGLYVVEAKADRAPMGLCGLLKRDALQHVDLGFAFLPEFWGRGYAFESAAAVLAHGRRVLGLGEIVAITSQRNLASHRLLAKLGFHRIGSTRLAGDAEELDLFSNR